MKLAIISHTEHYKNLKGNYVGWGPTITEINHLALNFDKIIHVAMLHSGQAPESSLPYTQKNIEFRQIPTVGGITLADKIKIVSKSLITLSVISKALDEVDCFQFRAPTGIGVYVIPYLIFFSNKEGWYKYAGDWNSKQVPIAYRFQKWMLKRQSKIVTINGVWPNQPKNCFSFENPCLTEAEIVSGDEIIQLKEFKYPINLCFVGRLEEKKGIYLLIKAIDELNSEQKKLINKVYLVGMGKDYQLIKTLTEKSLVDYKFCGFLKRNEVHDIYTKSHALILPSYSEGFPKVIPEAINFGCIPVITNISSVSHYLSEDKGILIETPEVKSVKNAIEALLRYNNIKYKSVVSKRKSFIEKFTFRHYINRLFNEILK